MAEEEEKEKIAFIIARIGDAGSPERRRIDGLLKALFEPVLKNLGFKPLPSHRIAEPGSINRQIIEHLLNDNLVICDLTFNNPNVMYELAVRHAVQKPVVTIAEEGTPVPFDVFDQRTDTFVNDPYGIEEFKPRLEEIIKAALKQEERDNPISRVVGYKSIVRQAEAAEDDAQRYILDQLNRLSVAVNEVSVNVRQLAESRGRGGRVPAATVEFGDVLVIAEGEPNRVEAINEEMYGLARAEVMRLGEEGGKGMWMAKIAWIDKPFFDSALQSIQKKYSDLNFTVAESPPVQETTRTSSTTTTTTTTMPPRSRV